MIPREFIYSVKVKNTYYSYEKYTDEVSSRFMSLLVGIFTVVFASKNTTTMIRVQLLYFQLLSKTIKVDGDYSGAPNGNFRENICSEDDLRSRIFGAFVVKFLACLPLLGFSNIYKMV